MRLNLYVGGYDNIAQIQDKIGTTKGFVGCVGQVVVNGYKFDLRKAELVGDAQFGANVGMYIYMCHIIFIVCLFKIKNGAQHITQIVLKLSP